MKKLFKGVKQQFAKMRFGVHPAFLVLVLFCALFGGLDVLLIISALALVHELGHAAVARRFGYRLKKIRLLPYGAEVSGDDLFLPSHEIKIALAGPMVNVAICVLCVAVFWLFPSWYSVTSNVFYCSLSLAVFNLLPFFPLDGGRVFLGVASKWFNRRRCLFVLRVITCCFGVLLLVLCGISVFYLFNVSFGIMGLSLIVSSVMPTKNASYERVSSKAYKSKRLASGLEVKRVKISGSSLVLAALSCVDSRRFTEFVVVDEVGENIGILGEEELEELAGVLGVGVPIKKCVLAKNLLTK